MDKNTKLLELARKRQNNPLEGYKNIGDYHNGVYECDFVSPYTKSAHNVDASMMVFLQDWSSHDSLKGEIDADSVTLGYTSSVVTNKNLIKLLRQHFCLELKDIYVTNLFPFIKMGPMKASIPFRDMVTAAEEFGLPQLEIVNPKIAIALGISTFNALRKACGLPTVKTLAEGIASPFQHTQTMIFCQAHTGVLGQNTRNRGGVDRVSEDWSAMASRYRTIENNLSYQ